MELLRLLVPQDLLLKLLGIGKDMTSWDYDIPIQIPFFCPKNFKSNTERWFKGIVRTPGFFPGFTCHVAIEVTRHFHYSLRTSRNPLKFQSQNGSSFFYRLNEVKSDKYCPQSWASRPCSCCKSGPKKPPKTQGKNRASQGGNLPRPQKHEPLHMLSLCVVSLTQTNVPFTEPLLENPPPRPLRLESSPRGQDLCDGVVDFHGRGQGLAEWVDGSVLRTQ